MLYLLHQRLDCLNVGGFSHYNEHVDVHATPTRMHARPPSLHSSVQTCLSTLHPDQEQRAQAYHAA